MNFEITAEEKAKVDDWLKTVVYPYIVENQRRDPRITHLIFESDGVEYPYTGAIGGGLTYSFSPTGLGVITVVTHPKMDNTGENFELNLTDYSSW